jgi:3-keto-5-aminohexanoate cleavage enzyme
MSCDYPMKPYPKVIINAAITGMIPTKRDTPHVPVTEDEIVQDAVACHMAGAAIIHLHIRDEQGNPCYKAEKYGRIIRRIREKCNVIICVSTSGRFFKDFEQRSEVLFLEGIEKPEMASITTGSLNFPKHASVNPPDIIFRLAETMLEQGIKPEIEIFDSGMLNFAKHLHKKLGLPQPLYFNLIFGSLGGIPARIEDIAYLINCLPEESLWSAAGIGVFQLPVNLTALAAGGGVRVGLEDNIYFDYEKKELATNVQLIERISYMAKVIRRELADADEARRMLCISPVDYSFHQSREFSQ